MTEINQVRLYVPPSPEGPDPWLEHALAAISEGICPEHGQLLQADGECMQCQCWWEADFSRQTVITKYPYPSGRIANE